MKICPVGGDRHEETNSCVLFAIFFLR